MKVYEVAMCLASFMLAMIWKGVPSKFMALNAADQVKVAVITAILLGGAFLLITAVRSHFRAKRSSMRLQHTLQQHEARMAPYRRQFEELQ